MTVKTAKNPGSAALVAPPAVKPLLREDEKLLRVAQIHWGVYWKTGAVGVISLLLMISPVLANLGYFLAFVTLLALGHAALYKKFLLLVLTDQRVFLRHGILRVDTIQIRHSRIESVETERTIMGQLLGYAVVVIYGTGSRRTAIPYIADALEFRNQLDEMLHAYEKGGRGKDSEE